MRIKNGEYLQFEVNTSLSPSLRKLIDECFDKNPESRIQETDLSVYSLERASHLSLELD